jgi:hypothetical protein
MFHFGERIAPFRGQPKKAQTLAEHTNALLRLRKSVAEDSVLYLPNRATRKANFGAACQFESCSNIFIRDLNAGKTHRGSVLKGRLVTEAIKMQSVQTLLEDDAGDVVKVRMQVGVLAHGNLLILLAARPSAPLANSVQCTTRR